MAQRQARIQFVVDAKGAIKPMVEVEGQLKEISEVSEKTQKEIRGIGQETKGAGKNLDKASGSADKFGKAIKGAIAGVSIGLLTRELGQLGRQIADIGMAFETQLADLEAITGIAGAELQELGNTAVQEAARTGVAAQQQVEAYKLLASNIDIATMGGIDGLKAMGREVVTLSQAAGVDLAQAANISASAINQWSLEAEESTRVINALAAGSKEGAAEVPDLGQALVNVGASAAAANVDIEETIGALEILAENGQKGARAGTQVRNMMTILRSEADKLAEHGIKNVNVEADGFTATLEKLEPLLGDATAMAKIFGRENINAAETLISNADAVDEMTASVRGTNTAQEQAAIQMNTTDGAMKRLRQTVRGMALQVWGQYKDEAMGAIEGVTQAIRENAIQLERIIESSGELAAKITTLAENMGSLQEAMRWLSAFNVPSLEEELAKLEAWVDALNKVASAAQWVQGFFDSAESNSSPTTAGEGATWMREASNEAMDLEQNLNAVNSAFQLPGLQQADEALKGSGEAAEESGGDAGDAGDKWENLIAILDEMKGEQWRRQFIALRNGALEADKAFGKLESSDLIQGSNAMLPSLEEQFGGVNSEVRVTQDELAQLPEEFRNTEITAEDLLAVLEDTEDQAGDSADVMASTLAPAVQGLGTLMAQSFNEADDAAERFRKTLGSIIKSLGSQALTKALQGGVMLGLSGTGLGALGVAASIGGSFLGMAHGGRVSGPGGPRDDRIPALLSNGEHVINARSAKLARSTLDKINKSPAFAARMNHMAVGGPVGNIREMPAPNVNVQGADNSELVGELRGLRKDIRESEKTAPVVRLQEFHEKLERYEKHVEYTNG